MKVLLINSCGNYSTGKIACDEAEDFIRKGNDVVFAFGRGEARDNISTYKIISKKQLYLNALDSRIKDNVGFNSDKATKKLIKFIYSYKPDLVHLHVLHGYYINVKLLFECLKTLDVNVLWTIHDCWPITGHCCYFDTANCEKWKYGCNNCPERKQYPKSISDYSKRNYLLKKEVFTSLKKDKLKIIVPSHWMKNLLKESYLKDYEIVVQSNEVNESIFQKTESDFREKMNIQNKTMVLSVASVWDKRKGLDTILKLSQIINEKYIFVLVGLNDKQLKLVNKYSNIIGLKRTNSQQELAGLYSITDIYFSPSIEESFGMTFLEAKKCGCNKIIGFNTTAIAEVVKMCDGKLVNNDEKRIENLKKIIEEW